MKNKLFIIIMLFACLFINTKIVSADATQAFEASIILHEDDDTLDYMITYYGVDGKINIGNIVEYDSEILELADVYINATGTFDYDTDTPNKINMLFIDDTTEEATITLNFKMKNPEEITTITLQESTTGDYAFISGGKEITFNKNQIYKIVETEEETYEELYEDTTDDLISPSLEATTESQITDNNLNIIIYILSGLVVIMFIEIIVLSITNKKLRKSITKN